MVVHVMPLVAILEELKKNLDCSSKLRSQKNNLKIYYLGSYSGIEKELIIKEFGDKNIANDFIKYVPIFTGRLRRRFTLWYILRHLKEFFCFSLGLLQVFLFFLRQITWSRLFGREPNQHLIFSGGGFVSVAPCMIGRLLGFTVWVHEQTSIAGLANRIASWFAHRVYISFASSQRYFSSHKTLLTGYPIRESFLKVNKVKDVKNISHIKNLNNPLDVENLQDSSHEQGLSYEAIQYIL